MTKIDALETIAYLALDNFQSDAGYTPERRLALIGSLAQDLLQPEYKLGAVTATTKGPNLATWYAGS